MNKFNHIAYIFNIEKRNTVGLQRAVYTAQKNQATLTILVINLNKAQLNKHKDKLTTTIKSKILELAKETPPKLKIAFKTGMPQIEIISYVTDQKVDLVITEPDTAHGIRRFFYGTTTLALIRKCPCAMYVIKPEHQHVHKKIMVAVDAVSTNPFAASFNDHLIQSGYDIATDMQAELHIVHAWESKIESAKNNPFFGSDSQADIQQTILKTKIEHTKAFEKLLNRQPFDLSSVYTHIIKGNPQTELAVFANKQKIDLVVMGSLEKVGIAGFFLGHTAESLINQIDCSILAFKPENFITPVKGAEKNYG